MAELGSGMSSRKGTDVALGWPGSFGQCCMPPCGVLAAAVISRSLRAAAPLSVTSLAGVDVSVVGPGGKRSTSSALILGSEARREAPRWRRTARRMVARSTVQGARKRRMHAEGLWKSACASSTSDAPKAACSISRSNPPRAASAHVLIVSSDGTGATGGFVGSRSSCTQPLSATVRRAHTRRSSAKEAAVVSGSSTRWRRCHHALAHASRAGPCSIPSVCVGGSRSLASLASRCWERRVLAMRCSRAAVSRR